VRGASNPWLERRVLAYAHQGGAWEAPSSTLFAIRRAIALGATGIELDVHATADRQLVVCHDDSVERTTDGRGRICELTLAELRALDNAYWFVPGADARRGLPASAYPYRGRAPADGDFAVARLGEVLELLEDHPGVALNLDIKQTAPEVEPYEEDLARLLAAHRLGDRVIVASFLDRATDAFSRHAPDVATSAGTLATALFVRAVRLGETPPPMRHVALQVPTAHRGVSVVDAHTVSAAHQAGLAVHVWTVNDEAAMESLVELGVDGIITDLPGTLVPLLERRGLSARLDAGTG
jgi:glycerophosphoryl diester phosphodiesterase